jgi:hypothetical protein
MPTVTSIDEGGTDYLYWVNSVEKIGFSADLNLGTTIA